MQNFRRPIKASLDLIENIVKAAVCLHNYLRLTENATYLPNGFVDSFDSSGHFKPGEWRSIVRDDCGLQNMERLAGNRCKFSAENVRGTFTDYFVSDEGALDWQISHIRDCGQNAIC